MTVRLGIDVGGTSIDAVATDGDGVLGRSAAPTPNGSFDALVAAITAVGTAAMADAGAAQHPAAAGIGVPGIVDVQAGTVAHAVNLGLVAGPYPLAGAVATALGSPTAVDNDVRAAALEALRLVQAENLDTRDLILLNIGTGVAAGLVVDGRPWRGPLGTAGEIGHAPVLDGTTVCACGLTGCLEASIAGPALARRWPHGDAIELLSAADEDPAARTIVDNLARDVAHAIHWLAATTGIDRIVLSGGVGTAGPLLVDLVRERLNQAADRSGVAARLVAPGRVTALPADHPTGALGAAALASAGVPVHTPGRAAAGAPAGKERT